MCRITTPDETRVLTNASSDFIVTKISSQTGSCSASSLSSSSMATFVTNPGQQKVNKT